MPKIPVPVEESKPPCPKCGGKGLIIVNISTGQLQSLCPCGGK